MKSQLRAIPATVATAEPGEPQETPTQSQKKSWESPPTLKSFIDAAQVILKQICQHPDYLALEYQPDLTVGDAQTALSYLQSELETNQQSAATAKSVSEESAQTQSGLSVDIA